MKIKLALLQLLPTGTAEGNLRKGIAACEKAAGMGADIALFPEMWNVGYDIPDDIGKLRKIAAARDSRFTSEFSLLAKRLGMAIAVTYLEEYAPLPRNSVTLFDIHGRGVFTYAKVHTCDFGEEKRLTPGDEFFVGELETRAGMIKTGAMICYDREFPESARILTLMGAELILVPNACPMEINRLSQLRGRAYENMVCVATCNYPDGQPDCNGHSSVFDGIAYLPGIPDSRDTCTLEADGREGIFMAGLDVDTLRRYRETEVHGNAYRRPELYGKLLDRSVEYPFIRSDARR